jgi:hypothetical protein
MPANPKTAERGVNAAEIRCVLRSRGEKAATREPVTTDGKRSLMTFRSMSSIFDEKQEQMIRRGIKPEA